MEAACPTTVTRSRWPRALTRSTQKPFSELWNVTPGGWLLSEREREQAEHESKRRNVIHQQSPLSAQVV